jgi:predicted regulator of Ras-like GTPase activity (Roadblock/LC7/MglB family)
VSICDAGPARTRRAAHHTFSRWAACYNDTLAIGIGLATVSSGTRRQGRVMMDPQLTSQIVPIEEVRVIEECLARLGEDTGGNYILLLDKSGQVIASQGDAARQDITALGALIAGTFASSREVAKLLREKDFRQLFTQGVRENIFIALIEDQWILCIIFNKGTHIGLVKVLTKKATDELGLVLERVREQQKQRDDVLGSSFRTSMEDTIDLLFRD